MTKQQKLAAALSFMMAGADSALAQSIDLFNNFSQNFNSNYGDGVTVSGTSEFAAVEFSTSTLCPNGCSLGTLDLNLSNDSGSADVNVAIYANSNNAPAGNALLTLQDPSAPVINQNPLIYGSAIQFGNNYFTVPSGQSLTLANNTDYWVEVSLTSSTDNLYWWNIAGATQTVAGEPNLALLSLGSGTPFSYSGYGLQMDLKATPLLPVGGTSAVPLPGAIWMMGTALIGLAASRRRKAGI